MNKITAADMKTPGQIRSALQKERNAFIKGKFKFENNTEPQYYNGAISRAFTMQDGSVYVEFQQFGTHYQAIFNESMGAIHRLAKTKAAQFAAGAHHSISVKGVRGRVNEKGICNIKQVTFLK